jgi:nitric oxide reductase subunit B
MRGWAYAERSLLRGALVSLSLVMLLGLGSAVYGLEAVYTVLEPLGLDQRAFRSIHTLFAAAWLVLGGLSVVFRWLASHGPMSGGDRNRVAAAMLLWAFSGAAALVTLPLGIGSGREYLGFHPALAAPILLGWLLIAWTFYAHAARGLLRRPVYVLMWAVGFAFFTVTFLEQYLWLLPDIFADPIVDRRVQWKATGTLVGAANLFVYGAALYLGERLSGDRTLARSPKAFALFGLGLLNSFVNFAHHTYHLPQSHVVKLVAFVVSMTEVLVLLSVLRTLVASLPTSCAATSLLKSSKGWTAAVVASAVLLSIPPLNAVVHGTWLIAGHAMGGMIGICSMVIFAVVAVGLGEQGLLRGRIVAVNLALALFVGWLHVVGLADGVSRLHADPALLSSFAYRPEWLRISLYPGLALSGSLLAVALTALVARWLRPAFSGRLSPWNPGIPHEDSPHRCSPSPPEQTELPDADPAAGRGVHAG